MEGDPALLADDAATPGVDALFDRHLDELYRFVHRRCRDHGLAEEIVQDVFLRALAHDECGNEVTAGWLFTVARNRLIDVVRRSRTHDRALRRVGVPDVAPGATSEDHTVDRLRLEAALAELSPDHRIVLSLFYLGDFTVATLAEHLGRSEKSIEGLLSRARRALRDRMGER